MEARAASASRADIRRGGRRRAPRAGAASAVVGGTNSSIGSARVGSASIDRSWLCRRAYDAAPGRQRPPARRPRAGPTGRRAPRHRCRCRRGSRCRRSRRGRARRRPRRPRRPSPRRTSGSRPRARRGRHRPARGRPRPAPAPRRNGPATGSPPAPRIASIASTGPRPVARHVGGLAPAEQPREGVLDARRVAGRDERPGDGRAAERIVVRPRDARELVVDRQVQLAQPRDGLLEPFAATPALGREGRLEGLVVRIHPEAEDVELALPQAEVAGDDRVDLDARDERHARAGRRPPRRPRGSPPACRGRSGPAGGRPLEGLGRTSSTGATTPSERVVWVCRSMVDGLGRLDPAGAARGQRVMPPAARPGGHVTPRRVAGCARWRGRGRWPDRCRSGRR